MKQVILKSNKLISILLTISLVITSCPPLRAQYIYLAAPGISELTVEHTKIELNHSHSIENKDFFSKPMFKIGRYKFTPNMASGIIWPLLIMNFGKGGIEYILLNYSSLTSITILTCILLNLFLISVGFVVSSFWIIRIFSYRHLSLKSKIIFIKIFKILKTIEILYAAIVIAVLPISFITIWVINPFTTLLGIVEPIHHFIYKFTGSNLSLYNDLKENLYLRSVKQPYDFSRPIGGAIGVELKKLERRLLISS